MVRQKLKYVVVVVVLQQVLVILQEADRKSGYKHQPRYYLITIKREINILFNKQNPRVKQGDTTFLIESSEFYFF